MFLVSFASYLWILTSFQRLVWGLVFFSIILCLIGIGYVGFKKKIFINFPSFSIKKTIKMQIVALIFAILAVTIKLWTFDTQLIGYFFSFQPSLHFSTEKNISNPTSKYLPVLDYYQVLEQTKPDSYVIRSLQDKKFIFKSSKPLQLGSTVYIGGSLLPVNYQKIFLETIFYPGENQASKSFFSGLGDFFDYQFNYDKWLMMKGFHGTIYPQLLVADPLEAPVFSESRFTQLLRQWRVQIKNIVYQAFPNQNGALLLGMMIGDRSLMPLDQYQSFVESGLVHIIAVSGGNIVMIVVFLSMMFFFLPFYARNVIIIIGITLFALLCGGDSSIIRALIMALLSLIALFWGRELPIWRLMGYAFFLMLLYNPYFLSYDLGFLLSFAAIIGIVIFSQMNEALSLVCNTQRKTPTNKIQKIFAIWRKDYLIPTLGATLGTLPILIFFVGTTNFTGVLANLVVVPFVPLITIGGFIAIAIFALMGRVRPLIPLNWFLNSFYFISDIANTHRFGIQLERIREKYLFVAMMFYFFWILVVFAKNISLKSGDPSSKNK